MSSYSGGGMIKVAGRVHDHVRVMLMGREFIYFKEGVPSASGIIYDILDEHHVVLQYQRLNVELNPEGDPQDFVFNLDGLGFNIPSKTGFSLGKQQLDFDDIPKKEPRKT
jgi:hypothetical protein